MTKVLSVIITIGLVVVMAIVFTNKPSEKVADNVSIRDGIQYITINAVGGYSPKESFAEAGIPTKLIMKTNGAFDCSASLVIHSINYQKVLPQTGETEIDLGTPKAGEPLKGVCGMGMYSFQINFS